MLFRTQQWGGLGWCLVFRLKNDNSSTHIRGRLGPFVRFFLHFGVNNSKSSTTTTTDVAHVELSRGLKLRLCLCLDTSSNICCAALVHGTRHTPSRSSTLFALVGCSMFPRHQQLRRLRRRLISVLHHGIASLRQHAFIVDEPRCAPPRWSVVQASL